VDSLKGIDYENFLRCESNLNKPIKHKSELQRRLDLHATATPQTPE
jgi:hypothetical protein